MPLKFPDLKAYRSKSGRVRVLNWRTICRIVLGSVLFLLLVFAFSSLYTVALHRLNLTNEMEFSSQPGQSAARKFVHDVRASFENLFFATTPPEQSELPTLHLSVDARKYDSLNYSILRYGFGDLATKPKVKALFTDEFNEKYWAKIGFRGTNTWHHQYWRPSLQIRLKDDKLSSGMKEHVLVAPEDAVGIRNWLSDEMGRRWGMLTYGEHFVRLFLNHRFKGVYTRLWKFDESLLIKHRLLPGPFFRLELLTGPVFKRIERSYEDLLAWEIEGVERQEGVVYVQNLLAALKLPTAAERTKALDLLVERDTFAKYLAILTHGGSIHVDTHNFALWLNPVNGMFVPLLTDVGGYDWSHPGKNARRPLFESGNPVIVRWFESPKNVAAYIERTYELLQGIGETGRLEALIRETWKKIRPDALSDQFMSDMGAANGTYTRSFVSVTTLDENVEQLIRFIADRNAWLLAEIENTKVHLVRRGQGDFELLTTGPAGVRVEQRERSAVSTLLPTLSSANHLTYAFHSLPGDPAEYRIFNRVSGAELKFEDLPENVERLRAEQGLHPDTEVLPLLPPKVLGPGEVKLEETLRLPEGQELIINAGTTLRLARGVSIFARGKVTVDGSSDAPVTIRPLDPAEPFGVFAILGNAADGSRISFLDIAEGSIATVDNFVLSGMFSVRGVPNITIDHSRFGRNFVGDDCVHILGSGAQVKDSVFTDSLSDAMDWDQVTGSVTSTKFLRCGNDCVDVSMSDAVLTDYTAAGCGDKCISVGEGSVLRADRAELSGGMIGVAVKDSSEALLSDSTIHDCNVGMATYMKKWRWGRGGNLTLASTSVTDSRRVDLEGDKRSIVRFYPAPPTGLRVEGEVKVKTAKGKLSSKWESH